MTRYNIAAPGVGLFSLLLVCLNFATQEARAQCASCASQAEPAPCTYCFSQGSLFGDKDYEDIYLSGEGDQIAPFRTQGAGWTSTSSGSSTLGQPATATWSVVPDGTTLPGNLIPSGQPNTPSDLISFLDGIHHGGNSPGGTDLTQRDWWQLINSSFERWDELSGVTFNYEPNDDGTPLGNTSTNGRGILGTRGDHRIGGHSIDGQTSPTFLAFNFFPNNSDMVIDTDEINRWSNASNNYRLFRNMLMHEIGHGLGLQHVESEDIIPALPNHQFGTFLMEPILSSRFDGPQFDDILGIHRLYGDVNEENGGNETYQTATMLGSILPGGSISIGTDADDTSVDPGDVDFVSIDDESDIDFFKFSIGSPQDVTIVLTPMGPTYDEGPQGSGNAGTQQPFVSAARNNLTLTLYGPGGLSQLIESVNATPAGQVEAITRRHLSTPGDYFVRVAGLTFNQAQFFQLDVASVPEPTALSLAVLVGTVGTSAFRRRR